MSAYTFGFIGAGNMGSALARAACRTLPTGEIILSNRTAAKAEALVGELGCAARIEIADGAITGFQLQLRKYTYMQQGPQVLPELQATAALEAQDAQGSELMLYYYDDLRADQVTADWGAF